MRDLFVRWRYVFHVLCWIMLFRTPTLTEAHQEYSTRRGSGGLRLLEPHLTLSSTSSSLAVVDEGIDAAAAEVNHPEHNQCSRIDMSLFEKGMKCGEPLSDPCFDFGRCPEGSFGIYVYDANCSLRDSSALLALDSEPQDSWTIERDHAYISGIVRDVISDAGLLAETYESACFFVQGSSSSHGYTPCAVDQPLWNGGSNHLLFDISDKGRNKRPSVANSYAMEAASNMRTCFYRDGYDISIPLAPKHVFPDLAIVSPLDREFFLTTKGSVYLSLHGSEERKSLVPLHDEESGVIMSMHCFEHHDEHLLPQNLEYCASLKAHYNDYGYSNLMNTTFGLVPSGRSPGTYRLGEVMSAGSIPVFIGRDIVLPFARQFDWSSFSFVFSPAEVGPEMMDTLRAVPREMLEKMQRKSLEVYREIFGTEANDFRPIAHRAVNILLRRVGRGRWR